LIGAGLFVRSLRNLRAIDPGFRPEHVLIFDLSGGLPRLGTGPNAEADRAATQATIVRQTAERVRQIRGVQSAGVSSSVPFGTGDARATLNVIDSASNANGDEPKTARFDFVSPGYFSTLGMRLVAGRDLEARDTLQTPAVAVINEALARRYFPSGNAIGRHMEIEMPAIKVAPVRLRPLEIVGIVADAKYNDLREQAQPMFYASIEQFPRALRSLEVRTTLSAAALNGPVRQALLEVTGRTMIRRVMTFSWQIDSTLGTERFITGLCTFFGALALLLASIGLYGVMAYGVAQRTNEIGIRMALGASRPAVLAMVLRQSLVVVATGVALGLPLAWVSTRALRGFLYGLSATDPFTIAAATLTLLTVAGLAAYLPARKATKVDPMIALRCE
jgi:putative ABC transport system permease protein